MSREALFLHVVRSVNADGTIVSEDKAAVAVLEWVEAVQQEAPGAVMGVVWTHDDALDASHSRRLHEAVLARVNTEIERHVDAVDEAMRAAEADMEDDAAWLEKMALRDAALDALDKVLMEREVEKILDGQNRRKHFYSPDPVVLLRHQEKKAYGACTAPAPDSFFAFDEPAPRFIEGEETTFDEPCFSFGGTFIEGEETAFDEPCFSFGGTPAPAVGCAFQASSGASFGVTPAFGASASTGGAVGGERAFGASASTSRFGFGTAPSSTGAAAGVKR
jgi:hypothetical protein